MINLEKRLPSSFSENPLMAEFMNLYYSYASERDNALGIVNYTPENRDIDTALDNYLDNFYSTYANHLKNPRVLDKKTLIKFLNSVYSAKGSENALKFVFQAMFGEEILISYPAENILKASDGVWIQEKFITASTLFGSFTINDTIEFSNQTGYFTIKPTRIEIISPELSRIYFISFEELHVIDNQEIYAYSENRTVTYTAKIVKTADKLLIKVPGEAWQLGQVLIIPGSDKDTIARVTAIDTNSGVASVEIIEYGYNHSPGQIITISPYPNKPSGSSVGIITSLVSINPDVYQHTITVIDYLDGIYETLEGVGNINAGSSYFLENYAAPDYSGDIVLSSISSPNESYTEVSNNNLTIEDWLVSRATLSLTENNIITARGYYDGVRGQISNSQIRLEDNYYYQPYSYEVETEKDTKEYNEVLKITHPAGMKIFSKLVKQSIFNVVTSSSRVLSSDLLYFLDIATPNDDQSKWLEKPFDSVVYGADALNNFVITKILATETVSILDNEPLLYPTKKVTDSVTASNLDTAGTSTEILYSGGYESETYFSETYAAIPKAITLTIQ